MAVEQKPEHRAKSYADSQRDVVAARKRRAELMAKALADKRNTAQKAKATAAPNA